MYSFLKKREHGTIRPWKFVRAESTKRAYSLQLSPTKEITRVHRGKKKNRSSLFDLLQPEKYYI